MPRVCLCVCVFLVLISKDNIVGHLMSIVPGIQFLVQRAVCQLRGVRVHVCECQAWHSVCKRVRVEGIGHVGIVTVHTIYCVEHTTNQEAVPIATTSQTCAEAPDWLQVTRLEVDEQDHFLVEALSIQSRIEQPQA